jgi:hypothetical protein
VTNESEVVIGLIDQALAAALIHENAAVYQQDVEQSLKAAGLSLEDAYPFSQLVPVLFDVLPKSCNGFYFTDRVTFDRNQDCVCGSGKKIKKCCSELISLPAITSEEMFYAALNKMDEEALLRVVDKSGWHKQALLVFFDVAMENRLFEAVAKLAPVVIDQVSKLKNNDDELVAMVLDALFEEGLNEQRFELMHKLTELKQAKSLRSLGYQRLAMIASQEGEELKAREYIQQAIQADAKQPELPMCELTVLGINGSQQELHSRAKYWLAFSKKRWGDDHPIVGFIEEVLSEGKALFERAQDNLNFDEDGLTDVAYENAMQVVNVLSVEKLPFVQTLEQYEDGYELHLKSSLMREKLTFMDLFDQQVQTVRQVVGDGFHYDEYVSLFWNWPNLEWLDYLRQHPELLADFDVLETLMPFVYQAPVDQDELDAELQDLSVFGVVPVLFRITMHTVLNNALEHLPGDIQLPDFVDANQGFWQVAFNVFIELKEAGEDDMVIDLRSKLIKLADPIPDWLAD